MFSEKIKYTATSFPGFSPTRPLRRPHSIEKCSQMRGLFAFEQQKQRSHAS